uniref:Uncharacterized protein n=1 Tax=Oryza glaberrima TaxID=4538 RepID=I1PTG2_ORYGL
TRSAAKLSYMVDETYFTIQAELEAQFKEVWAKIDWSGIETADWDDFNGPNYLFSDECSMLMSCSRAVYFKDAVCACA